MSRRRSKRHNADHDTSDKDTKILRGLCHKNFDQGWKNNTRWPSRTAAYEWLQEAMGLPQDEAHIKLFDRGQCLKLLKLLGLLKTGAFNGQDFVATMDGQTQSAASGETG